MSHDTDLYLEKNVCNVLKGICLLTDAQLFTESYEKTFNDSQSLKFNYFLDFCILIATRKNNEINDE